MLLFFSQLSGVLLIKSDIKDETKWSFSISLPFTALNHFHHRAGCSSVSFSLFSHNPLELPLCKRRWRCRFVKASLGVLLCGTFFWFPHVSRASTTSWEGVSLAQCRKVSYCTSRQEHLACFSWGVLPFYKWGILHILVNYGPYFQGLPFHVLHSRSAYLVYVWHYDFSAYLW